MKPENNGANLNRLVKLWQRLLPNAQDFLEPIGVQKIFSGKKENYSPWADGLSLRVFISWLCTNLGDLIEHLNETEFTAEMTERSQRASPSAPETRSCNDPCFLLLLEEWPGLSVVEIERLCGAFELGQLVEWRLRGRGL